MTYLTYKCPICNAEFSNPEELRRHRLIEHKNVIHENKLGLSIIKSW